MRLENAASPAAEGISLRIVQPNIPQSEKWRSENAAAIIDDLIALSTEAQAAGAKAPTHIVWPESAVPLYIDSAPHALAVIADDLPDYSTLIMGSLRRKADGEVYNSLFALDGLGRSLAVYDKWHLVPYGEYLPFAELLEPLGLRRVVTVPGSFAAGEGIRTIAVPGTPPFSPLICYEAIFPGSVASPRNRPEWLLNVTNDGWFGSTSGPYQHLAQARFRAIEEGLPVVRAANTGISAVIDAHGRVVKRLPLNLKGRIDAVLPAAIAPTFYARYGDLAFFLMLILCGATAIAGQRRLATIAANTGQKPVNQN
jgi:apolipoprotein N-acyltransferase